MIKVKKRKKATRFRGTHTHGRGAKKKARGKGHRGGVGMAGTGKKADQKKTLVLNLYGNDYFGTTIRLAGRTPSEIESVDLRKVVDNLDSLIKKGIAKAVKDGYEINFENKKVLCTGEINVRLDIKALSASKSAIEKIRKAGGKIEFKNNKKEPAEIKGKKGDNKDKTKEKE